MRQRLPWQQRRSSPAIADGWKRKGCRQSSDSSGRLFTKRVISVGATSIIVRRSFRQFRLHDETVLCRVHIAFQHAERDFHELRIALADLDVAGFELLTVADENDGAILDGLQRRGFDRDSYRLRRKGKPASDEQAGPQPQLGIR